MQKSVNAGDIVIDATCGQGNDTLFLAGLVGESGKVLAFDIQAQAIIATRQKLAENNCIKRVQLINDSHENLDKYSDEPVDAIMFNLGFLPGSKSKIITTAHTTLLAIQKALDIMQSGGLMTIVFYPGHDGGQEELNLVRDYLASLPQASFEVSHLCFINQVNNPPQLIVIQKLEGGH